MMSAEKDVHLSYRLGGCATDAHPTAVTDAADAGRVTCPICLPAARIFPPGDPEDSCCTCGDPAAGAICHHVLPPDECGCLTPHPRWCAWNGPCCDHCTHDGADHAECCP